MIKISEHGTVPEVARMTQHISRADWNGLLSDLTRSVATELVSNKYSLLKSLSPVHSCILSKLIDSVNFNSYTALSSRKSRFISINLKTYNYSTFKDIIELVKIGEYPFVP